MATKNKRIEFDLPDGFVVPEDLSSNQQFEALATIKLKDDGKACLVALDDYRMPGYQEEDGPESSEPEEDNRSYSEAASEGMPEDMQEGY